jgi:hypothetical protein
VIGKRSLGTVMSIIEYKYMITIKQLEEMQKWSKSQKENERILVLKKVVLSGISEKSLLNKMDFLMLKISEHDKVIEKIRLNIDVLKYKSRTKYFDLKEQLSNLNTLTFQNQ